MVPSLCQKISMVVGGSKSRVIIPKIINQSFMLKVKTTADLNQRGSKIHIHNLQCTTFKIQLPSSAIENRESSCHSKQCSLFCFFLFFTGSRKAQIGQDWQRSINYHISRLTKVNFISICFYGKNSFEKFLFSPSLPQPLLLLIQF